MPWKRLSTWFAEHRNIPAETPMPLTMVTLRGTSEADPAALAFHAEAEFAALMDWAMAGRFVLAFTTLDGSELTLLCPEPLESLDRHVEALPMMVAGLASADLRVVTPLKLTVASPALLH